MTPEQQKLHNSIGNALGECKKRLFDRLKDGANLQDAVALFVAELSLALEVVAREA